MLPAQRGAMTTATDTPRQPPPSASCSTHVPLFFPSPSFLLTLSFPSPHSLLVLKSLRKCQRHEEWAEVGVPWQGWATPENFFCHFHYFRMRRAELEAFHFYNYFSSGVYVCLASSSLYYLPPCSPSFLCPSLIAFSLDLPCLASGKASREGVQNV